MSRKLSYSMDNSGFNLFIPYFAAELSITLASQQRHILMLRVAPLRLTKEIYYINWYSPQND